MGTSFLILHFLFSPQSDNSGCFRWFQFSSVTQSCPTLSVPVNRSTPGLPFHHQLLELTQTHVHQVGDAIQPSHPLSSPSPLAPNPSQHQGLFQWVSSLHEVAKVLGVSASASVLPIRELDLGNFVYSFLHPLSFIVRTVGIALWKVVLSNMLVCFFPQRSFYWSIVDLQCCVSSRYIARWFSYVCIYDKCVYSFSDSFSL